MRQEYLTDRECSTLVEALRCYQRENPEGSGDRQLTDAEIDDLCEAINTHSVVLQP